MTPLRLDALRLVRKRALTFTRTSFFLGAMMVCVVASAGSTNGALITSITTNTDFGSYVLINTSVTKAGAPSCATNTGYQWVLPLSSALDNQIYAQLLAAFASQSTVNLAGDGACTAFGGVETVVQVQAVN